MPAYLQNLRRIIAQAALPAVIAGGCGAGPVPSAIDLCKGWVPVGQESGYVRCQTAVRRAAPVALEVSRDNLSWKRLDPALAGRVEVSMWALPARDANTNFTVRLAGTLPASQQPADGQPGCEAASVATNETDRWHVGTGDFVAPYTRKWTRVRLVVDTERNSYEVFLDERRVAGPMATWCDVRGGIAGVGLASGRAAQGHRSYVEDLAVTGEPAPLLPDATPEQVPPPK